MKKQNQKGISTLTGIIIIVAVAIVAFGGVFAYQYFTKPQNPNFNAQPNPNVETADWQGIFSITGVGAGYEQIATLKKINSTSTELTVIGSDVRPNEPACSFTGTGTAVLNTLTINLDNSQYEQKDAKIIVKLSADNNQLTIEANSFDNRFALMRFCYGGGSIGGVYVRK